MLSRMSNYQWRSSMVFLKFKNITAVNMSAVDASADFHENATLCQKLL